MAKSNMRSAGIRRHHRRIHHQARVDKRDQEQLAYKQKMHVATTKEKVVVSIADICAKFVRKFSGYVSRFFRSSRIGIDLDLTKDSVFEPGQRRDAGAQWLRGVWPGLGTMVSTRDGKIIR